AAGALYSVLAEEGRLTPEETETFYEEGTLLPALPPFGAFDDIPFATGSLGYGLSICAGMALGAKFKGESKRFFCVTSDGELNEGSVWEAALFIAHHRLNNVIWMIDRNKIQAIGRTEDVLGLEPLSDKLTAFGFRVLCVNGHDFSALITARERCESLRKASDQPIAIIADTVKGHGVSFMENTVDCHYLPLDDAQYAQAVSELASSYEHIRSGYEDAF